MRKLKLHIGLPKTGSSSIQSFLHLNADSLSKQGVFVPNLFDEKSGHTSLVAYAALATGLNFSPFVRGFHKLQTEADIEPFKERFEKRFEACLVGHENKNVVMTSELFFTELRQLEQLEILKTFLSKFFSKIEIIAYVRSQENWISSRLSQTVKLGSTVDVSRLVNTKLNNYFVALEPWWEVFGWSNFHLRVFEKEKLIDSDLISDFLYLIEANNAPDFIVPERKNQALSIDAIEFLQSFNKHIPYFLDNKSINPLRSGLTEYMETYSESNPRHQLSQAEIKTIREKFEPSNEKLKNLFFPTYQTLFTYRENKILPNDDDRDKDQMKISAYLWGRQQKKLSVMKTKIEYLETALEARISAIEREGEDLGKQVSQLKDANTSLKKKIRSLEKQGFLDLLLKDPDLD